MTELIDRISRLEMARAAERLKYDYALSTDIWRDDPSRFARFASLFTADGVWDDGDGEGAISGKARMADKLASLQDAWGLKIGLHLVANPRITITDGDVQVHWQMLCALQGLSDARCFFASGHYEEVYSPVDGELRVAVNTTFPAFVAPPVDR